MASRGGGGGRGSKGCRAFLVGAGGRTFFALGAWSSQGTKTSCSSRSTSASPETGTAPFLPRRAEPTPPSEGSCSRAQTTMRMVD